MKTYQEIVDNITRFVKRTSVLNELDVHFPVEIDNDVVWLLPRKDVVRTDLPVVTGEFKQTLFKNTKTEKEKFYRNILFQTAEDSRLAFRDTSGNIIFEGIKISSDAIEKYVAIKDESITAHVVPIRNGLLSIGHRPKVSDILDLRDEGFTHVVTVLGEAEKALEIGREVKKLGLLWIWLPLGSAKTPVENEEDMQHIETVIQQLVTLFHNSETKVYLHCSAGMHRTGMITFVLLRRLGYDPTEAMVLLTRLRELTAHNVGEERIAWANSICESA